MAQLKYVGHALEYARMTHFELLTLLNGAGFDPS